jgi:hypothetical protein
MLKGIIFVRESIISLDLKLTLSQHYSIVNTFKNIQDAPEAITDVDFIVIDSDPYQEKELRLLLQKIKVTNVKIISLVSSPKHAQSPNFRHVELPKPFDHRSLIKAIEQC